MIQDTGARCVIITTILTQVIRMTPNEKANEFLELYGAQAPRMVKKEIEKNEDWPRVQRYWKEVLWYVAEQLANKGAKP